MAPTTPFRVDFSDLILAHARIGSLDVTYLEGEYRLEGTDCPWTVSIGTGVQ